MTTYNEVTEPYGWELILDCQGGNENTRSREAIEEFARTLVKAIDMEPYGAPIIEHFGKEAIKGYTLVQLIQTSSITVHFCDDSGDFYLNCHSCKPFDEMEVIRHVSKHFHPVATNRRFIVRGSHRIREVASTVSEMLDRYGC
jgi:S-adenosylmethionine decarboxylase